MKATLPALFCLILYYLGYRFYAGYLSKRVFDLDDGRITPAHRFQDNMDFVPTRPSILYGHHFASITGLSPMLGPAIAVIWGWLPGMLWVVLGAIMVGCVHDFSSLVVSIRARGLSIGKVAEGIIGQRAKTLFHLIIFFGLSLAMGVFAFVIAKLFQDDFYPQSVLPSGVIMMLAVIVGYLVYHKKVALFPATLIAFLVLLLSIYLGMKIPVLGVGHSQWVVILLAYALLASILPVWLLLQPRDFINSWLLYLGLGGLYLGFFFLRPTFASPMLVTHPKGAPPIFPFVFITIACGAVSGFHSLVSSGTTAKQLDKESHARPIGYGGMIGESLLGLIAVLACTAGFASPETWQEHYASWHGAGGLGTKINAFVEGSARFLSGLGISPEISSSFIAIVVISFALTTLDSGTRLLRYNISEMGSTLKFEPLQNRYLSSILAVLAIAFFAFFRFGGRPAGLSLWALFGTTNQLLAALALLTVTLYLYQRKKPILFTAVPTVFMLCSTLLAMGISLKRYFGMKAWILFSVGFVLLVLAVWLVIEAILCWQRARKTAPITDLEISLRE